MTGIKCSNL